MFFLAELPMQVEQYVTQKPPSEWVYEIPSNWHDSQSDDDDKDEQVLFQDIQVNAENNTIFVHVAYPIKTDEDKQLNSNLQILFNPTSEKITFHSLQIHRNGKVFDCLDVSKMKVLQQEHALHQLQYTGNLTLLSFLENVQVGDLIEYSYSSDIAHPYYTNHSNVYGNLAPIQMTRHLRFRIICNKKDPCEPVYLPSKNYTFQFSQKDLNDTQKESLWEGEWVEQIEHASFCPKGYLNEPYVFYSDFKSWNELATYDSKHFMTDNEPLLCVDIVREIQNSSTNKEEMVLKALDYVQKQIRYLGIETGINSHKPFHPNVTFEKEYGDCKGKTFLLKAMLEQMGIPSNATLVSTQFDRILDKIPPGPWFGHVILYVNLDGREYWLDSTISSQYGNLSDRSVAYKNALIISPNTTELKQAAPYHSTYDHSFITTHYYLKKDTSAIEIENQYVFSNSTAIKLRKIISSKPASFLRKRKAYLEKLFGPLAFYASKDDIKDDLINNLLHYKEKMRIKNGWLQTDNSSKAVLKLMSSPIHNLIDINIDYDRTDPLAQKFPYKVRHVIYLHADFPIDLSEKWHEFNNPFFNGLVEIAKTPDGYKITRSLETLTDEISLRNLDKYRIEIGNYYYESEFTIYQPDGSYSFWPF